MNKAVYAELEKYMLLCMKDCAHDKEHVYRVLYLSLDIADHEKNVDIDVLIAASLLHDIGRTEQLRNPQLRHEDIGSEKAYSFLLAQGWTERKAVLVRNCILTHRFRSDNLPESIEAKILFDADKLDATGAIGIARTLQYKALVCEPLYTLDTRGNVLDGTNDTNPSFFQEYKFKLEKLYDRFFTKRGEQIANHRKNSADFFYNSLLQEVCACYSDGAKELFGILK